MVGKASLFFPGWSGSPRNLVIARCGSCDDASVEVGGLIATNAIASAADKSVHAIVTRRVENKRVCLNGYEVCILQLKLEFDFIPDVFP